MKLTRRNFTAGISASAGLLFAQKVLAQATPEASPVAGDMESRIQAVMDELGIPGAVIAMTTPESAEPVIMELGLSNLETQEPISADMHFRIASVTKTYVATVVLQLVDEELLSLDDTIANILPDLDVANADTITVRNLLSMRSGLDQLANQPEFISEIMLNPTEGVEFSDYVELMSGRPAAAEPDTMFDYNNFNFDILGEMIHTVTDLSWDENVQQRISDVLDLSSTTMTDSPEMPAPFATGYGYLDQETPADMMAATPVASPEASPVADATPTDVAGEPVNEAGAYDLTTFNPTIAGAAGGLISTVHDQLVWVQALSSGELLSEESHAAQFEVIPMDDEYPEAGSYGLGLIDLGSIYGHNGALNGYQSAILSAPEFGINLAVLTNAHPTLGFADGAFGIAGTILS